LTQNRGTVVQYVYSAWAPQFADKLHLTTTESNLIGAAGNLGMYSMGVPIGLFIDHRGPRPAVIAGSLCLGLGYYPFRSAYDTGSGSLPVLCLFSFLTGLGGCMAFAAAVKTSALNWPHHRGTATAFPLAAFGLSAFFFSVFGGALFPGSTSAFLALLAAGTFCLTFVGFFFLRVYPHTAYHSVPTGGPGLSDSQQLRRTPSVEAKPVRRHGPHSGRCSPDAETGTSPTTYTTPEAGSSRDAISPAPDQIDVEAARPVSVARNHASGASSPEVDETSSLMSKSSTSPSLPGDVYVDNSIDKDRSHRVDIRGMRLLRNVDFWQLFAIMGILAGIGLMTIK
jgi:hypothetical protein